MTTWPRIKPVLQGVLYATLATWFGIATPLAIHYLLEQ